MEVRRQALHALVGICIIACIFLLGLEITLFVALSLFLIGMGAINEKLMGSRMPIADELLVVFERPHQPPAHGAFWYAVGLMLALSFLSDVNEIVAVVYILAISDAVSTVAGIRGRNAIPYNKAKTVEGSLAFFAASLPAFFIIGPVAVLVSAAATLVESLDLRLNDNLTVPLACVVVLSLV